MSGDKTRKNLAFVSHTSKLSGAALSYYVLLRGLDSKEFSVFPILPELGALYSKLEEDGYHVEVITPQKYFKSVSVSAARKYLRASKIDLLYLSCTDKYCRLIAASAYAENIPIVWHVREPPLGNRVQKSMKLMKKYKAKAIAVSQEQYDVLVDEVEVVKVDNGVDPQRFDRSLDGAVCRKRYGLGESDVVFGIVGTIERRKNVKNFLLAASRLACHNKSARFIVVGSGSADYIDEMKALVTADQNLSDAVVFTGSVWNVPEIMAGLDVLVMPSNWEAFPRVVIEGMTMGLPVIATDVGDVSYIIDDEENGFVIPKDDLNSLTAAMEYCLRAPEKLETISQNAAEKAQRLFSQRRHVDLMQSYFTETISKAKGLKL